MFAIDSGTKNFAIFCRSVYYWKVCRLFRRGGFYTGTKIVPFFTTRWRLTFVSSVVEQAILVLNSMSDRFKIRHRTTLNLNFRSTQNRFKLAWFAFRVVPGRIRFFPIFISKIKRLWTSLNILEFGKLHHPCNSIWITVTCCGSIYFGSMSIDLAWPLGPDPTSKIISRWCWIMLIWKYLSRSGK